MAPEDLLAKGISRAEASRQASFRWEPTPDPEWMTKAEVARLARISLNTVEKLVSDGILESYRVGARGVRFKREDVLANVFRKIEPTKGK